MSFELIDIVDENDNVVKTIERTPEWNKSRPDIFRAVNIFTITSDNKIVIQQRSKNKSAGALLFDTSVGGIVTSGYSYEDAAVKEMKEELGIESDLMQVSKFLDYKHDMPFSYNTLFVARSDGPFKNWEHEAERLEYFTFDELNIMINRFPYLFTGGLRACFNEYKKYLNRET